MEDEINLIDVIKVIFKYRFLIIGIVLISLVVTLLLTGIKTAKRYAATATLIQIQSDSASGGISRALAGANFFGNAQYSWSSNPVIAVLESKTLAKQVVEDINLIKILSLKNQDNEQKNQRAQNLSLESVANIVRGSLKSSYSKSGALELTVSYSDPVLAAQIANSYAKQLIEYVLGNNFNTSFKILDPATTPSFPINSNQRRQKLLISLASSLFAGIFLAFFIDYWRNNWGQLNVSREKIERGKS